MRQSLPSFAIGDETVSSILDALRKTEQEARADNLSGPRWHRPVRLQSPRRQSGRRWWPLLGVILLVGSVFAGMLWLRHVPDRSAPETFETAVSAPPLPIERAEPQKPAPPVSVPEKEPPQPTDWPARTIIDPPPVQEKPQLPVAPQIEPAIASPMVARREERTEAMRQPAPAPASDQVVRSDPRITLQALVWAPDAADRFVVINNRLIKEGGSVDAIVVVQIDRDAVLLAEGADRWHQPFRLR